ncbi:MAG: TetR family transcriptional regulator [Hyphomicrobiales bacterium]|nr:TetR family transcriptional regulator [Hyphomicrobiales bacterium]
MKSVPTSDEGVSPRRKNDPDRVKRNIIEVATAEFASNGLSGARVDEIAAKTATSKRMIYYYFGSKEGLYLAVLEQAYAGIRSLDSGVEFDGLPPDVALRRLVEITFDYHEANPDFIRLVSIENIHRAEHLRRSATIRSINDTAIEGLAGILKRGQKAGLFRPDIDPLDVHLLISALCFFRVSNRSTFSAIFDVDFAARKTRESQRKLVVEAVVRLVLKK